MIDNTVEPFKNIPERFVTCSGFVDSLVDALSLILKRLPYQFDRIPEGDVGKYLVIASPDAGKLLGKGGEMIRKLSEETNTVVCSLSSFLLLDSHFQRLGIASRQAQSRCDHHRQRRERYQVSG